MTGSPEPSPSQLRFETTSWTRVFQAAHSESPGELAALCQQYWFPLYAFCRRAGRNAHDSEDTIQGFFVWLIESNVIERADPQRGKFRTFLLVLLQQFQARQYHYQTAAKRMPKFPVFRIDQQDAETRYQNHLYHTDTPEVLFEHAWAISVIEQAMDRLRQEMIDEGKGESFECLRGMMTGQRNVSGRDAARQLTISECAVRSTVHRMKQRFAKLLRQQVALTVEYEEDVDTELQELFEKVRH